jgi:16S rRNA (guanine(966)-N(2))-methyltransferase RsmD
MRIIAGEWRGRKLVTVPDRSVRPATDRVKGSIFNILQNRLAMPGAKVLDLFAGSGSLGFEALSRGAASCIFVESDRRALEKLHVNIGVLDCEDQCDVLADDAARFVSRCAEHFDLIFADPPYAYVGLSALPDDILARQLLKKDGFLIIEHPQRVRYAPTSIYTIALERQFGNTKVTFFTPATPDATA